MSLTRVSRRIDYPELARITRWRTSLTWVTVNDTGHFALTVAVGLWFCRSVQTRRNVCLWKKNRLSSMTSLTENSLTGSIRHFPSVEFVGFTARQPATFSRERAVVSWVNELLLSRIRASAEALTWTTGMCFSITRVQVHNEYRIARAFKKNSHAIIDFRHVLVLDQLRTRGRSSDEPEYKIKLETSPRSLSIRDLRSLNTSTTPGD